jgi:hypothetical protein
MIPRIPDYDDSTRSADSCESANRFSPTWSRRNWAMRQILAGPKPSRWSRLCALLSRVRHWRPFRRYRTAR